MQREVVITRKFMRHLFSLGKDHRVHIEGPSSVTAGPSRGESRLSSLHESEE
jgi:hypothetical protein